MQRATKDPTKGDWDTTKGGEEEWHKREKKGAALVAARREMMGTDHDLVDRTTL